MNTATKVIAGAALIGLIAFGMRKKEETANTVKEPYKPNQTDYEGKLVVMDNGHWFVVKDGKRWYTGSVEAIVDFQAAYPGNNQAIENVPASELERYPISGHIQAGLNFVPYGKETAKLGNSFQSTFIGV
ncbi:hypothetical protein [Flavobacterium sp.]|uniref:hypothetical protein n=1 Tax=Flavobacterium sp. TaxID=239 RepID=UPI00391DD727